MQAGGWRVNSGVYTVKGHSPHLCSLSQSCRAGRIPGTCWLDTGQLQIQSESMPQKIRRRSMRTERLDPGGVGAVCIRSKDTVHSRRVIKLLLFEKGVKQLGKILDGRHH